MPDTVQYRLTFEKTGRAIYISHLDLMRTMQRAFLRAGLPLAYSQGFNPHARMRVLLPLSVGTASLCERMDVLLREALPPAALPGRLNPCLPEGLRFLECYAGGAKPGGLKWLRVAGRLEYDGVRDLAALAEAVAAFFQREEIVVEKKTKRGFAMTDIRPAIRSFAVLPGRGALEVDAVLSAQEPTLNPELLPGALRQLMPELAPDFSAFTRLEIYDAAMQPFR